MENLNTFLNKLSTEELEVLYTLLAVKDKTVENITAKFSALTLPFGGRFQEKLSYRQVLGEICEKENIEFDSNLKTSELERDIFQKLFVKEYEELSEVEKQEFINKLEKKGLNKNQIASLTSIAAITAAQASGFGIYLLASTTVGAITSLLGVTLPFVVYTTMSSVISVLIGPVGFLVLGYGMYKSFKDVKSLDEAGVIFKQSGIQLKKIVFGDIDTSIMVFKYIASMRIIKINDLRDKIALEYKSIANNESYKDEVLTKKQALKNNINLVSKSIQDLNAEIELIQQQLNEKRKALFNYELEDKHFEDEIESFNEEIESAQTEIKFHKKDIVFYQNN
ncbi:hypothetical protein [Algibacter sp. L3A6]|uniref:hypothetical protein n=1 Tax=Algibacter sp. L3A6 TaxID=2686366 RepID=UPI00131DB712|nr:hypothetical protein [Algibacter sp. L3A6]